MTTDYANIVKLLENIVGTMFSDSDKEFTIPVGYSVNYQPGLTNQIVSRLYAMDNSLTLYNEKYPIIAVVLPIFEERGNGFQSLVRIPRIVIANLTKTNTSSEYVLDKYSNDGVFETILYPCYREFLKRIARNNKTSVSEPNMIKHKYIEMPYQLPLTQGMSDFVDAIEIRDLEIILTNIKIC